MSRVVVGSSSSLFVPGFKERTRGKHLLGSRECNFLRTGLPRAELFFLSSDELMGLKPHRSWNRLLSSTYLILNLFQICLQAKTGAYNMLLIQILYFENKRGYQKKLKNIMVHTTKLIIKSQCFRFFSV